MGVWIETDDKTYTKVDIGSHPSWVCGLKLDGGDLLVVLIESHPSWVCGLKQYIDVETTCEIQSHPSWVCGLKHHPIEDKE